MPLLPTVFSVSRDVVITDVRDESSRQKAKDEKGKRVQVRTRREDSKRERERGRGELEVQSPQKKNNNRKKVEGKKPHFRSFIAFHDAKWQMSRSDRNGGLLQITSTRLLVRVG